VDYRTLKKVSMVGIIIMLLVLTVVGIYGLLQLNKLNEVRKSLIHQNDILVVLHSIFTMAQGAETGQRGFLITGNEDYLAPYNEAVLKIDMFMERMRKLTANNQQQTKDITTLENAIAKKMVELKDTINLRRTKGFAAARDVLLTNHGKNQMDIIRNTFSDMFGREYEHLMDREQDEDRRTKNAFLWLFLSSALAITFQVIMGLLTIKFLEREKLAAQALAESEERFRLLLSGIKDYAIFMLDAKGVIKTWNLGAQQVFGYASDEIIGNHVSSFYTEEHKVENKLGKDLEIAHKAGRHEEETIRVRKDGSEIWVQEVTFPLYGESKKELDTARKFGRYEKEGVRVRKDGSEVWVNEITIPVYDDERKNIIGFARVTRDITEQKEATVKLREQANLLDLSRDAVIVRDLDGTIRYWNKGAEKMYGFNQADAMGKVSYRLLKTGFMQPLAEIEEAILNKGYWEAELVNYTRDGRRLIVSSRNTLKTDVQGEPVGVLELNTDITVHKQAEQRQLALAEMKRVNLDLEQFASIASHDLQEPLRAISGCLQILEKSHKNKLEGDAAELIQFAVDGSARMRNLINDLLSLSSASSSDAMLERTDLTEVLEQALKNIDATVKEKGATITHDPLPVLTVQKTLLVQLFQNLLSNALKFCKDKPPEIHVSSVKDGNRWQICICDNGIGFESENAKKIFQPFKRLHGKNEYPGTGIGLAICKRIVERHAGTIWAESEVGKGAKFCFTLTDFE
jgi:PAS domain S-box-containing protein